MRKMRMSDEATWVSPVGQDYQDLLSLRIKLGRRRVDMLCHKGSRASREAAVLHSRCAELDEILASDPRYGLDQELRVLPAEEPRFHSWPTPPLDYESDPCPACLRLGIDRDRSLFAPVDIRRSA
jgi:hypothetical protein